MPETELGSFPVATPPPRPGKADVGGIESTGPPGLFPIRSAPCPQPCLNDQFRQRKLGAPTLYGLFYASTTYSHLT